MKITKPLLLLALISSFSAWGRPVMHPQFNFQISTNKMKAGDLHYAFVAVDKEKFLKEAGPFAALLTIAHPEEKSQYALIRSVFPIKKAVGSIDSEKFNDLAFVKKIVGKDQLRKVKEHTYYSISHDLYSNTAFSKYHFDSDDLTSIPDSKIAGKIAELRISDPLLQSANAVVFKSTYGHKGKVKEDSEFFGFISLDESKTLVVYMKMIVFPEGSIKQNALEKNMLQDVLNLQKALSELAP